MNGTWSAALLPGMTLKPKSALGIPASEEKIIRIALCKCSIRTHLIPVIASFSIYVLDRTIAITNVPNMSVAIYAHVSLMLALLQPTSSHIVRLVTM